MDAPALSNRSQYFTLTTDGACETFYCKARGLQQAAYSTFGAVGREHTSGTHGLVDAGKDLGTPHLGLLLWGKSVEVDDVNIIWQRGSKQVAATLFQGEMGRNGRGLFPWCGVGGCEDGCVYKGVVAQTLDELWLHGIFLQSDVVHGPLCRGRHGGDGCIESCAKAYLEQAQGTRSGALGSIQVGAVAVDVKRFGVGSFHGVVVLVKFGHEERSRAIVGVLYLKS